MDYLLKHKDFVLVGIEERECNMFRLYGDIKGWELIKRSEDEFEIIDALGDSIKKHKQINYIIIKSENGSDFTYKVIYRKEQYYEYLYEYRNKIESCQNLIKMI